MMAMLRSDPGGESLRHVRFWDREDLGVGGDTALPSTLEVGGTGRFSYPSWW